MLRGCDVSSWQSPSDWSAADYDFVIMKASEGVTITDSQAAAHYKKAQRAGLLTGFYHYARPEYNTAEREAEYFASIIRPYIGKSILALDYEGTALAYGQAWAKRWLDKVHELTGVKPLIYLQGSAVGNYKTVCDADYGLWVAHWGVDSPRIGPWHTWALWQYRGDPLDLDYFNGDRDAWMKYAGAVIPDKPAEDDLEIAYKEFVDMWKRARDDVDPFYANLSDVPEYWRAEVEALIAVGAIKGDSVNQVGKRRSELQAIIPAKRYVDWYFGEVPGK